MKSTTLLISAVMLIILGVITGLNESQVSFAFIIAGIIVALYAIRCIQVISINPLKLSHYEQITPSNR